MLLPRIVEQAISANVSCDRTPAFLPFPKGPIVVLFSFPGSGNTWFRQLLTSLTGAHTGKNGGGFLAITL